MSLRDILERGYFPKELPPPFVTGSFANIVTSATTLPSDYQVNLQVRRPKLPTANLTKYSHARGGLLRRQLSLPNPILYFLLVREIELHWLQLQSNIGGTPLSSTAPEIKPQGRAIDSKKTLLDRPRLAVQTRLNKRYILKTDINRFYHSIYTHAIPWAMHTKRSAKRNRGMSLMGNRLDYLIRQGQDGQTVGIPIGPDSSLVIAEAIMQTCDRELLKKMPSLQGHRFIDDYELGFRDRTEAEEAFHFLEKILTGYELALNPKKTKIEKLPCYFEEQWIAPLRNYQIRKDKRGQESDLIRYFDIAFNFHWAYPGESVLKYAIGRLKNINIIPDNWPLLQRLLLNCAVPEPATFPQVLQAIITQVNKGAEPEKSFLEETVNSLIEDHSSLGHSSEVAWALWACLALGIPVHSSACKKVVTCDDSVVALLALHCESEGLCADHLVKTLWSGYMTQQSLYEDQWLLSYEANIKGWLSPKGNRDHVAADSNFGFLKANGVSFYDTLKAVRPDPTAPIPVPKIPIPSPVPEGY